jgi:hypothetical protein
VLCAVLLASCLLVQAEPLGVEPAPLPGTVELDLRAEVSSTQPYVGEGITLTWALTGRTPVRELHLAAMPQFEGFWVNELEVPVAEKASAERLTLRRFRLFPLAPGRQRLQPVRWTMLAYPATETGYADEPIAVERATPAVELEIRPLPAAGRPATFSCVVGHFTLAVSPVSAAGTVGDAVRLFVEVRGDGNLEAMRPPNMAVIDGLVPAPPRRVSLDLGLAEGAGPPRAAWAIDLVPSRPGDFDIGPIWLDVFDPRSGRFARVQSAPVTLTATPRAASAPLVVESLPVERAVSWPLVILGGVLVAASTAGLLWLRRPARPSERSPAAAPATDSSSPRLEARVRAHLGLAAKALSEGDHRSVHAHVLGAIGELARAELGVAPAAAEGELDEALRRADAPESLRRDVAVLVRRCLEGAFAAVPPPADETIIKKAATTVRHFLEWQASRGRDTVRGTSSAALSREPRSRG